MPVDRPLNTVLQAYRGVHDYDRTNSIISTTTSLLTTLSNPLNIILLTSQLLIAPAIWSNVNDLRTCLRIVGIFNTAAITVHRHQLEGAPSINCDAWATAVIKGADDKSPRWKHSLVIAGVLLGMEGQERHALSRSLRMKLEEAMVFAANNALLHPTTDGFLGAESVVLALNLTFPLISDDVKRDLNYDILAPIALRAMVTNEGYERGYFLGAIDLDVKQVMANKFHWATKSRTFGNLRTLASKPLVSGMGPLSRLIGHAIENMKDHRLIMALLDDLLVFTSNLPDQWRKNKLSEVDISEESLYLTPDSLRDTVPLLWQVLKGAMFATVIILRSIISRSLVDATLANPSQSPIIASKSLHIMRNIYFISSRFGSNPFEIYTFVFLSSLDILSHHPPACIEFLESILGTNPITRTKSRVIPTHPLDRIYDLYFLNVAENLIPRLPPSLVTTMVYPTVQPYLSPIATPSLREIFEAAHSTMLAILSAPQNSDIAKEMLPGYVEALFACFPQNLSSRQFRFAFKTLIGIVTPPSLLAASDQGLAETLLEVVRQSEQGLAETLLEVVRHRALHASTSLLPPPVISNQQMNTQKDKSEERPLSEQAILMLTLIDALPSLPIPVLEEWLPLTAETMNVIQDLVMREICKERYWEVLNNGEMDVDRSPICLAWWTTRGGREQVLFGKKGGGEEYLMSGGLGDDGSEKSRL